MYTIYWFYCTNWANFISLFALELFRSPCCLSESEQTSDQFLGCELVTYHFLKSGLFLPHSVSVRMWWDVLWHEDDDASFYFFSLWVIFIYFLNPIIAFIWTLDALDGVREWMCVCFHVCHPGQFLKCVFHSSRLL